MSIKKILFAVIASLPITVFAKVFIPELFIGQWTGKNIYSNSHITLLLRGGDSFIMPINPDITYNPNGSYNTFIKSDNAIYGYYDYTESSSDRLDLSSSISNKIFIMPQDSAGNYLYILLTNANSITQLRSEVLENGFHSVTIKVIKIRQESRFKAKIGIKNISDTEYQYIEFSNSQYCGQGESFIRTVIQELQFYGSFSLKK